MSSYGISLSDKSLDAMSHMSLITSSLVHMVSTTSGAKYLIRSQNLFQTFDLVSYVEVDVEVDGDIVVIGN
jgi:hypothetical protein